MSPGILIFTDDLDRSEKCVGHLHSRYFIEIVDILEWDHERDKQIKDVTVLVIDVNLINPNHLHKLKHILLCTSPKQPKIFFIDPKSGTSSIQAEHLGATYIFKHAQGISEFEACIKKYIDGVTGDVWAKTPEVERKAFKSVVKVNDSIIDAVQSGAPLPKSELSNTSDLIISSLEQNSIFCWLDAVKEHHSYTHRHCITVTGLAVAFGQFFKMSDKDLHRLAVGALVHDIGKVKIPLSILDKPGKLTPEERKLIETHPIHSSEILSADGQFDEEVINVARHHHEYLDGTGYPDGLKGDEINNLVRVMTIIDIFSALVDKRAYKEAMPKEKAYSILLDMGGKLDQDFVKAFKPIAFGMSDEDITHRAKDAVTIRSSMSA